jgi:hypothetical protein
VRWLYSRGAAEAEILAHFDPWLSAAEIAVALRDVPPPVYDPIQVSVRTLLVLRDRE